MSSEELERFTHEHSQKMKKIISIFLFLTLIFVELLAVGKISTKSSKLNVATYNIRLQTTTDSAARSWDNRKSSVARLIKQYDFDIFGVQEVGNATQETDLKSLITNYTYFGKGRDNQEGTAGEQIGIFYKTNRFVQKEKGFFFLSETPDTISKGWDAAFRRICVWTKLYDLRSKTAIYVFCTHFDHIGKKARVESAKLIVERIKKLAGTSPVLCLGDLNTSPESSEMYKILTSSLKDSREISLIPPKGSLGTFNGYDISTDSLPSTVRIDYILCKKIKVLSYQVLSERYNKASYPSDHFPVMIECEISKQEVRGER